VGYASVDVLAGANAGRVFQRQAEQIAEACERHGLKLLELVREREPQRGHVLERPALSYALGRISVGDADGLVVADLSRLTRSAPELGRVLEWFGRWDARLVSADPSLDTKDEAGRFTARTIIDISRWERQRLVERTREGMRAARSKGLRGVADYPELSERIRRMRAEGMTLQAISDQLNTEGVPTVRGGVRWRPSSVQAAAGYRRPSAAA
jgi:DNA invertase Pin-like site-specific DNA recombinase